MTVRTDIHRPSAPEFDPQAYECEGVFDLYPEPGFGYPEIVARRVTVDAMKADGFQFASHQQGGQCGHCGAHIRYAALLSHEASHEMIWVGETCLDNRFESLTKAQFQALRKAAALNAEKRKKAERIAEAVEAHPLLAWATYPESLEPFPYFLGDIAWKFRKYGEVSEKQIAAFEKVLVEATAKVDQAAAKKAAEEAAKASGAVQPAPVGNVLVQGSVVSTKVQDGYYGSQLKMLVQAVEGYRVWVTVPKALGSPEKGQEVMFTAELTPSDDDAFFAFGKRPKAVKVA